MNREKLNEVFDWLEKNANKNGLLYFELTDYNVISGYFKTNDHCFADFYINKILQAIEMTKESK